MSMQKQCRPGDRRILVVDDNEAAVKMLGMLIQMHGGECRTALNGQEAIQLAEQFRPDIILMDIRMPKMNGCEAARIIRQKPWGKSMNLIAVTGVSEDEIDVIAAAGFNSYILKPLSPSLIEHLINFEGESTMLACPANLVRFV